MIENIPLLTFRTKYRGPILALLETHIVEGRDIIDEALFYFRPNVFFKQYEIQTNSDRILIYVTLYTVECLKKLSQVTKKDDALKEMYSLAISRFDIPGDPSFTLNSVYGKPKSAEECGML